MIERELIAAKVTRAQQVFEGIESAGFSSKTKLRPDVTDPAQFLENYERVGLIKESIQERVLPEFRARLETSDQDIGKLKVPTRLPEMPKDEAKKDMRRIYSFTLPNGIVIKNLGKIQQKTLRALPVDGSIISADDLAMVVYGDQVVAGNKALRSAKDIISAAISGILNPKLLGPVDYKIENIVSVEEMGSRKTGAQYRLVPLSGVIESTRTIPSDEERKKEELGEFDIRLDEGLVLKTQGTWEKTALSRLVDLGGEKIPLSELSTLLFGNGDPESRRTVGILRKLNLLLPPVDLGITWDSENAWLIDKKAEAQSIEQTIEIEAKETLAGVSQGVIGVISPEEAVPQETTLPQEGPEVRRVIPYELPEREVRTEEETRILQVLVEEFASHTRLYFDDIQRQLRSEQRIETRPDGDRRFYIYTARELKEKVEGAYRKMVKEQLIPLRRQRYTEADEKLYAQISGIRESQFKGDSEQFLRALRSKVDEAERDFYTSYKPEDSGRPWIKI